MPIGKESERYYFIIKHYQLEAIAYQVSSYDEALDLLKAAASEEYVEYTIVAKECMHHAE